MLVPPVASSRLAPVRPVQPVARTASRRVDLQPSEPDAAVDQPQYREPRRRRRWAPATGAAERCSSTMLDALVGLKLGG